MLYENFKVFMTIMPRKHLRDFDILKLLGNGQDSDLSSLSDEDGENDRAFPTLYYYDITILIILTMHCFLIYLIFLLL